MRVKSKLVILGTGRFAEEIAHLVGECDQHEVAAFAEGLYPERCDRTLLGLPVIWVDALAPLAATHDALCAIGATQRASLIGQVEGMGFRFATLRHPLAYLSPTSTLGAGSILSVGAVVATHVTLGRHVIVNRGSLIGHHTTVEDFVTISPGANIAASVRIGSGAFIGMGAIIFDHIRIGDHAVVGGGAVVAKDIPDHAKVMGAPARLIERGMAGR